MAKEIREIIAFHEQLAFGNVGKLATLDALQSIVTHAEQKGALLRTMPDHSNPDIQVNNSIPKWDTWRNELDVLRTIIDGSQQAFSEGNETSREGWDKFFIEIERRTASRGRHANNIEDFVGKTIGYFNDSYGEYSEAEERPTYTTKRRESISYRRSGKLLTPRELRLVILKFGLNGIKLREFDLAKMEGLKGVYQSLDTACMKTGSNLVPHGYHL